MLENLFKQDELNISTSLKKITILTSPQKGVLRKLNRVQHYSDEPKPFKFSAISKSVTKKISDGRDFLSFGVGYSFFSEEEALIKCIGEAIERYCLKVYKKDKFFYGSYKYLKRRGAINPSIIASFSEKQRKKLKNINVNSSDNFYWAKGYSLTYNEQVLIPAQLVYLSYKKEPKEKIIRLPLSTGAAGGACLASALCRGIYEVVERDAFMIHWLNKLTPPKVNMRAISDTRVQKILNILERYLLKINVLDITTDLNIPTFLSVLIDETGIGLPVSLGLKSHLNPINAIVGSMQESLNPREWIRREVENNSSLIREVNADEISTTRLRGIFWFDKNKMNKLHFLIKRRPAKKVYLKKIRYLSSGEQLKILLKIFKNKKYEVSFVDIGMPKIRQSGYEVVFVFIPELHPLYLDEKYPYLGGRRLYQVPRLIGYKNVQKREEDLYQFPHPFL